MGRFEQFKCVLRSWLAAIVRARHLPFARPLGTIGILAYGSLLTHPGTEIEPLIMRRIAVRTPFSVEYARYSGETRGGAPTVVAHRSGGPVRAEILVLQPQIDLEEAKSLLWRRETRRVGTGKPYPEGSGPNAVLIGETQGLCGVEHVLHTDFNAEGKLPVIDPGSLAEAAIDSVSRADPGMDGISYLMELKAAGVETPLTQAYTDEILSRTGCATLPEALEAVNDQNQASSSQEP